MNDADPTAREAWPAEQAAPGTALPPVKLWRPRDVAVISFLLGFPGGIGLAARNWYRLGQRRRAFIHLLLGGLGLFAIVLLPTASTAVATAIDTGVAIYLYLAIKADVESPALAGRVVERGGVVSGFATVIGGWLLQLVPVVVIAVALGMGSTGGVQAGTVAVGTGGSGCQATGVASAFPSTQSLHVVAAFSRRIRAGEVLHEVVTGPAGPQSPADVAASTDGDCVWADLAAGALLPGSYTIEYDTGSERLALGQVTITTPAISS